MRRQRRRPRRRPGGRSEPEPERIVFFLFGENRKRFRARVWVSLGGSLRRDAQVPFYAARGARGDRLGALRHPARSNRLDENGVWFCVVDIFPLAHLLKRCVPTHHPTRSGDSRGPGRRDRACPSRGSQQASARLHLWCERGGRGGWRIREGEEGKEKGECAKSQKSFFFPSTARKPATSKPQSPPSSQVPLPPAPRRESEMHFIKERGNVTKNQKRAR